MWHSTCIIWRDCRNEGRNYPDLYLLDLRTGAKTRLTAPKTMRGIPYIRGDHVFWEENINGIDTIIQYTIPTGIRSVLQPGWLGQTDAIPPVSGDRIVWKVSKTPLDIREEEGAVMVMDLRTGEKNQSTPFRRGLSFPAISGDRIVYTRGVGEDWSREPREVVLYTLTPHPVTAASTINTGTDAGNTNNPSLLPKPENGTPSRTTSTASPGFSAILLITGLAVGAILGRTRYKE